MLRLIDVAQDCISSSVWKAMWCSFAWSRSRRWRMETPGLGLGLGLGAGG